ncbi:MAG TPA: MFS transporter, partial [Tepidisphaeraceae bacterium]|nr:MFS transporter [Tepidisphaeraceae bacterium]
IGVAGAVVAALVGAHLHWRTAYYIGGGLGIVLLCLRIGSSESRLFQAMTPQWSLWCLVKSPARLWRYTLLVLIALPTWYVVGIIAIFTPEIARAMNFQGTTLPTAGNAIMYTYIGIVVGDLASGLVSQLMRSRIRAIVVFTILAMVAIATFFMIAQHSLLAYYGALVFIGFSVGYWAVFVTLAAESFGTNLRGTVATSVPNFVRGAVIPMTMLWQFLKSDHVNVIQSTIIVGAIAFALAFVGVFGLKDTFTRDLDYQEN